VTDLQLDTLEARGLVRPAAYEPELEYLFRHVLVQDAAYESLLKQQRRELHLLVGEAIERLYPERGAEMAGVLAMHFEQAGDTERALAHYVIEGAYALERNALREAAAAFTRARGLLPAATDEDPPEVLRRRITIELGRARATFTLAAGPQVEADLQAIVPAAERLGDLELLAQVYLYLTLGRLESGRKATEPDIQQGLNRLAEIGTELDDPSLIAMPMALVGLNKVFVGPTREGVEALERAIPLMESRRDFIGAAFARGWLTIGYASLGEFDRAAAAEDHTVREAARGDLIAQLDAQIAQAMVRSLRGDLDEAEPIARACVDRSQETGAAACAVVSAWVLGDVYQRQGRFDDAREILQLGMDLAPVSGNASAMWRPTLQAWLGTSHAMLGVSDPDDSRWDTALAAARQISNGPGEAGILWKRAEVRAKSGQLDAAIDDYAGSAAILGSEGLRPTLARVLRGWGTALLASGQHEEGRDRLERAGQLFLEMGIEREAEELRRQLSTA
jgi:tetratricopeptide (TPR) repeat protein